MAGRKAIVFSDAKYLINIAGRRKPSYLRAVRSEAKIYHSEWARICDTHVKKVESTA
jgi:hypothetical protein